MDRVTTPVRVLGYPQPLAPGTCDRCGAPVVFNLSVGVVLHIGPGVRCEIPWPATPARPDGNIEDTP